MSEFIKVIDVESLSPGQVMTVTVKGRDLCLANYEGEFFALENKCPHRGGQLGDGTLTGPDVICPLHQWDFDVRTGVSRYDSKDQVTTYPVRQVNGGVEIDAAAVAAIPVKEGYLQRWARQGDDLEHGIHTIHKLARGIYHENTPMRTERPVPSFDDIYFLAGQLADPPLLDDETVDTTTIIGG
jgi:nitrite reductase/ring-hydroxylating ferredoxin subunit